MSKVGERYIWHSAGNVKKKNKQQKSNGHKEIKTDVT